MEEAAWTIEGNADLEDHISRTGLEFNQSSKDDHFTFDVSPPERKASVTLENANLGVGTQRMFTQAKSMDGDRYQELEASYSIQGIGELSSEERKDISDEILLDFILQKTGNRGLGNKSRSEWLHDMVLHLDSVNKCKDQIVLQYKTKLDSISSKLETITEIKKKQKVLLQKKESEIAYLIDSVKQAKETQMTLLEQFNSLQLSNKSMTFKKK